MEYFYHLKDNNGQVFASVCLHHDGENFTRAMTLKGLGAQHNKKIVHDVLRARVNDQKKIFSRPGFSNRFKLPPTLQESVQENFKSLLHSGELMEDSNFFKINPNPELTPFERTLLGSARA